MTEGLRHLVVVLGDQLDPDSAAFDGFDPARDGVWMAEVVEESTHVWSHKARIALFLSAMRHFAQALRARGWPVEYHRLGAHDFHGLSAALADTLVRRRPAAIRMVRAGDCRVEAAIEACAVAQQIRVGRVPDTHFIATEADFGRWADGRRQLRLEYWYRALRKRTGVLMDGATPAGGQWNYDQQNRASFGAEGPGWVPEPVRFMPDAITREVIDLVEARFPTHPGSLRGFDWPVTPAQAAEALDDFITHRLASFGHYQDAMWTDRGWLYHSRLSAALNLKLIDPMTVCRAAEQAWRAGMAPIAAVEGFVRQILGWREYVRGLYWRFMPGWLDDNALDAHVRLPSFFWTGQTDMACLRQVIEQTLATGYAHHIQRLMVTGLYALLLGVAPRQVHAWYLAIFVDAVEWVELPNVLGMSQHADGGRMASKPYVASGKYIERMSNYCRHCRFDPGEATGETACPFTTLYWDFLARHRARFAEHPRLALQVRNLDRIDPDRLQAIRAQAAALRGQ
ncbi:cryptochrome/photolyase family protein [Nitrogeniibacter mangrovi]|uniref:Cryptochrome/photolyase family protein n=1 Tax=Nitrogeniibacter mangrovi TaxID=2016596 RepID=A0A6C1B5W6_9RHOO|nr:cryptochrome/photolyase family protein [Nitrogeniibacter mangrovi]QID18439.1 cryptochrome/photolyase family protein [Nitrogeniibacter mangrovi]